MKIEKKVKIKFTEFLEENLVEEFEKKIYYISENIISFKRIIENSIVTGIEFCVNDDSTNLEEIEKRAYEILEKEIMGLKDVKTVRVWDNDDVNYGKSDEVLQELLEQEIVHIHGEGQIGFKEPLIGLFNLFDYLFRKLSTESFQATEYIFPTLLNNGVLKKVGYFDSFPNLLMFTVRLKNEIENYNKFKEKFKNNTDANEITKDLLQFCCGTNYGLPPTMCYYVYDMLSGKQISNQSVTARGKSFRFENKYYKPFERLWDFTIRETVFLGDFDYVKYNVKLYREKSMKIMELIGIHGYCETANDPFFLVDNVTSRINVQKMFGSKYELRARINEKKTIAMGSFNQHGQFLSKRFNLYSSHSKDEYIYTGCIGIGLERFIFAFLSQYGTNPDHWPKFVNDAILNNKIIDDAFNEKFSTKGE